MLTLDDIYEVFIEPQSCEFKSKVACAAENEGETIRFDKEPGCYLPEPVSRGGILETTLNSH